MSRPLTVAVFGSSVTALVAGQRPAGAVYRTWPHVLTDGLPGVDVRVHDHSRIYGLVTDLAGAWATPLTQLRPDVVVLQYGLGETFPCLVPKSAILHALAIRRHSSPVRDRYWSAAHSALRGLHQVEHRVDAHLPRTWCRLGPRRFERELRLHCTKIRQQVGSRLVLMTAYGATDVAPFLTPRMASRLPAYNEAVRRVAAEVGADVFDLEQLVDELGPTRCLPDGLHLTVDAHRLVGERLLGQLLSPVRAAA